LKERAFNFSRDYVLDLPEGGHLPFSKHGVGGRIRGRPNLITKGESCLEEKATSRVLSEDQCYTVSGEAISIDNVMEGSKGPCLPREFVGSCEKKR